MADLQTFEIKEKLDANRRGIEEVNKKLDRILKAMLPEDDENTSTTERIKSTLNPASVAYGVFRAKLLELKGLTSSPDTPWIHISESEKAAWVVVAKELGYSEAHKGLSI